MWKFSILSLTEFFDEMIQWMKSLSTLPFMTFPLKKDKWAIVWLKNTILPTIIGIYFIHQLYIISQFYHEARKNVWALDLNLYLGELPNSLSYTTDD